jgi:hypothetical protein
MTRLILPFPPPSPLAPADAARAGAVPSRHPVAEIVTFRLAAGTTEAGLPRGGPRTLLAAAPGFVSRRLSLGADGPGPTTSPGRPSRPRRPAIMADARGARPSFMAIDPASIVMRHERASS